MRKPNALRYAALTGRLAIRWDGARQPTVWTMPRPTIDPFDARVQLARRYLHVFGPGTVEGFAQWAGIKPPRARAAVEALAGQLTPVGSPIGDAWILSEDEKLVRTASGGAAPSIRLLPSGDTYFLLWGLSREARVSVEVEAQSFPLPGVEGEISVRWEA